MLRGLVVLALLGAVLGGFRPGDPGASVRGADAIAADAGVSDAAALRTGGILVRPLSPDRAGSTPFWRPRTAGRGSSPAANYTAQDARCTAFRVRLGTSRHHCAASALVRAGRLAFATTTPPPSRVV